MACGGNCNRDFVGCENECLNENSNDVNFLVLNSQINLKTTENKAQLFPWKVNTEEDVEKTTEFTDFYGDSTTASKSCSMVSKGQMYIIGGLPYSNQISIIDDCVLSSILIKYKD